MAGIHHLVNGLFATRSQWARYVVGRAELDVEVVDIPAATWKRPSRVAPLGGPGADSAADRRTAALVARRHGRLRAGAAPRRRACAGERAERAWISALPGVRYGTIVRHADGRGSFRELWRAPDFPGRGTSSRPTCRPRRPASSWPPPPSPPGRPVDRGERPGAGRAGGRPAADRGRGAVVETRELGTDESVLHPDRRRPRLPRARPAPAGSTSSRTSYDGSDELGFAWDDPAVGVDWPTLAATPGGRPVTSERDAANPSLAELVVRLRAGTA